LIAIDRFFQSIQFMNGDEAFVHGNHPVFLEVVQHPVHHFPGGTTEIGQVLIGEADSDEDPAHLVFTVRIGQTDQG
jgi:hypothetical protein